MQRAGISSTPSVVKLLRQRCRIPKLKKLASNNAITIAIKRVQIRRTTSLWTSPHLSITVPKNNSRMLTWISFKCILVTDMVSHWVMTNGDIALQNSNWSRNLGALWLFAVLRLRNTLTSLLTYSGAGYRKRGCGTQEGGAGSDIRRDAAEFNPSTSYKLTHSHSIRLILLKCSVLLR